MFGPMTDIQFGKLTAEAPRRADIPSFQLSARVRPSAPTTRSAIGMSVTWNPVPKTITSASASLPSAPTNVEPRISLSPLATTSTFGWARAG